MYHWIWQAAKWPRLTWDNAELSDLLGKARLAQGKLLGLAQSYHTDLQTQINADMLSDEMMTTTAIEGAALNRQSVRSSIAYRLGVNHAGITPPVDRAVEGLLDVMLDATDKPEMPLKLERLYAWHAALFPTGYSGIKKISVGQLRGEGQMRIVSGRAETIKTHYIAPPYQDLKNQMSLFLKWFNQDSLEIDGIIRAAVAHCWFEVIHPFDDGNGRIGRAIVDMALAQDEKQPMRFYSLSKQIMAQRKSYYEALGKTSSGDLDITCWIKWFLNCFVAAIQCSNETIKVVSLKSQFWREHAETQLNTKQCKVLNRLLDKGADGFEGGMTTKKYMHLTHTSRATAYRELHDLVVKKCLRPLDGKGRSSAYEIFWSDL